MSTSTQLSFVLALCLFSVPAVLGQQDFSKVEIKATRHSATFYTLDGQGGRIGVLAGPEGVLMVDSQFAPLTGKIVAAIKQINAGPVRFLINTHVHGDHTGGNENLGKMGVTIVARPDYDAKVPGIGTTGDRFVGQLYAELKGAPSR